jgi:ABC-type phosphate transport system substrate-binding protein
MTRRVKSISLFLALVAGAAYQAIAQTSVAVVVSETNSIATLRAVELRQIFAGEKRSWPNGKPIKLFVRGPGTLERDSLLALLRMSESEYRQYWTAQIFRGEAQAEPVVLPSNGMQKEALRAFPGGIALVNAEDVKAGMKILKIDGHLPGESGYPLINP